MRAAMIFMLGPSTNSGAHYNIARAYGTNGLNQLTSAGATALAYDLRGNLTSLGADAYAYTSENRMSRGKGAYLGYDGAGRLLFTTNAAVTQTTYFDDACPEPVEGMATSYCTSVPAAAGRSCGVMSMAWVMTIPWSGTKAQAAATAAGSTPMNAGRWLR
jgi:hypothetical protein